MSRVFLTVLNMSLTASYAALAVIASRFFLNKAPKIFSYALWIVVLFRLLCPFTLESHISLMPSYTDSIPENIGFENPAADTGDSIIDNTVNNTAQISLPPPNPSTNVKHMDIIIEIGAYVWIAGIIILSIYGVASYFKLKTTLTTATFVNNNIFETDKISTPFVLGIIRPKIFIPVNISENELDYIVKHEQTHIKRYDYIIKLIAFTALMIHWFNPLMWISYFLMSKDMEMSCDESVMKSTNEDIRLDYSNTLLALSVKQSRSLIPLAFGESNAKSRIKNILNYKKTPFWILAASVVIVLIIIISLVTNPIKDKEYEPLSVLRPSVLFSEEIEAQETAKRFIIDLYTVDTKEVDNYKFLLNSNTLNPEELAKAMQINDEVIKSLMTDSAYNTLLKNRENLKLAQACHEGNYTMQVVGLQLSENKNNIENNEAGYNFEVQLKLISNDGTETTGTAKGLAELEKIEGNWKITGYRNIDMDY